MKQLEELLDGSFCVVGNSPKEIGSGNGELIDSYDTVIRFKNYDLSGDFGKDYGTKTTVLVTPFNLTQFYRDPLQYECVCCCIPLDKSRWRRRFPPSNINYDLLLRYKDAGYLQYIPNDIFTEIWEKYPMGQPSSGITTLWWIHRITGRKIPRSDIFGFSMFDPRENHHYYKKHIRHEEDEIDDDTRNFLETEANKYKLTTISVHPRQHELHFFNECTCE